MITVPTWRPSRGIAALFVSILHFCILYVALDRIGAIQIDNSGAPNRGETADGALALAWIDLEDRDASNPQNPLTDNMRPLKHAEQIDGDRKLSQLGDGREHDEAENSTVISVEVTDRIDAWNLFTEDLRVRPAPSVLGYMSMWILGFVALKICALSCWRSCCASFL